MKTIVTIVYPAEFRVTFTVDIDMGDQQLLEEIFGQWNHGSGQESELFLKCRVRSLSVNDFVVIEDGDDSSARYYQCASVGWHKSSESMMTTIENETKNHPTYENNGPWSALDAVMRTKRLGLHGDII